ncbi:MAG: aldehyde dehydrogenase [Erysipelotrichaceae bacterium]|nr:aldehyde dehydrogenase [Erysipelotrichaceae bacterium]
MKIHELDEVLVKQKEYFNSGITLDVTFRINMLKKLYNAIKNNEEKILNALTIDLGKSEYEGYMCEVGLVLSEITYMIKNVRKLSRIKRVSSPLVQIPSKSYKKPSPYGNVLIMSPWNYPFLLTIDPLVDAIAAGNTCIVKPSAYSPKTSEVIEELIVSTFSSEYVGIITGGRKENAALLEKKFDLIFFTGSQGVGKEVLRKAAENLTPSILELGGKSPCIVTNHAKIKLAARRIVFGKFLNCGQTCVAPDYILAHESIKDELVKEIVNEVNRQFGINPLENKDYGKIINEKHFERLKDLILEDKVVVGGKVNKDTLQIVPTVMDNVTYEDKVMEDEIFGPILPILTYNSLDEVIHNLGSKPRPLALYLFSESKEEINKITSRTNYGGGCINDVVVHLSSSELGFGGVGESGMGVYHGKDGFNAFSYEKNIMDRKTWLDLPLRYQPYNKKKNLKILKSILK